MYYRAGKAVDRIYAQETKSDSTVAPKPVLKCNNTH